MRALVPGRRTAWFYLVSGTNRQFSSAKQGSGSDGVEEGEDETAIATRGMRIYLFLSLYVCLGPTGRQLCDRRSATAFPPAFVNSFSILESRFSFTFLRGINIPRERVYI